MQAHTSGSRNSITQKELSDRLGVSTATISRALNNDPRVRPEVREMVRKAAHDTGYRINHFAASLAKGSRDNTVGYIVYGASLDFFSQITRGIEKELSRNNYYLLLGQTEHDPAYEKQIIESFIQKQVSGLIIIPNAYHAMDEYYRCLAEQIPVVFINIYLGFEADYVLTNDEQVACDATSHLLELGHRRVLLLGGSNNVYTAEERRKGYRRAHQHHGVPLDPALECQCGYSGIEEYNALLKLEEEGIAYTAVICLGDSRAPQNYFAQRGMNIPEDVSFIYSTSTFDDGEPLPDAPKFTVIEQPAGDHGIAAARMVIEKASAAHSEPRRLVIPSTLRRGLSTAPPGRVNHAVSNYKNGGKDER